MMHIDNKHRVLPIAIFQTYEQFMFAKQDFGTNPLYIVIGDELHGWNVLEDNRPCKLADHLEYFSKVSEIPETFAEGDVAYIFTENQIYHKWDGDLQKGFVFPAKVGDNEFATLVFSDYIDIDRLEVFETCEQICNTFFEVCDFETGEGKLKPITEGHFFYCKENQSLYAIVDMDKLNCIATNVRYGGFKVNTTSKGLVVTKSKRLFKDGQWCKTFSFTYKDMIWNIRFA